MLGVGVGFDTLGAGKVTIHHHEESILIRSVIHEKDGLIVWEPCSALISVTRESLILTIQGSGHLVQLSKVLGVSLPDPDPLQKLHNHIVRLFENRAGQTVVSSDIVDIMNMAGKCVVSANVRRSAEIALGLGDDEVFLDFKDWGKSPRP